MAEEVDAFFSLSPIAQLSMINCLFEQTGYFDKDGNRHPYSENREERKAQKKEQFWTLYKEFSKRWEKPSDTKNEYTVYSPGETELKIIQDAHPSWEC